MIKDIIDAFNYIFKINHITHRDLKPLNILLNLQNELLIVDFGISKVIDSTILTRWSLTVIRGSRDYMSPDRYD